MTSSAACAPAGDARAGPASVAASPRRRAAAPGRAARTGSDPSDRPERPGAVGRIAAGVRRMTGADEVALLDRARPRPGPAVLDAVAPRDRQPGCRLDLAPGVRLERLAAGRPARRARPTSAAVGSCPTTRPIAAVAHGRVGRLRTVAVYRPRRSPASRERRAGGGRLVPGDRRRRPSRWSARGPCRPAPPRRPGAPRSMASRDGRRPVGDEQQVTAPDPPGALGARGDRLEDRLAILRAGVLVGDHHQAAALAGHAAHHRPLGDVPVAGRAEDADEPAATGRSQRAPGHRAPWPARRGCGRSRPRTRNGWPWSIGSIRPGTRSSASRPARIAAGSSPSASPTPMAASALWTLKRPARRMRHRVLPARRADRDVAAVALPDGSRRGCRRRRRGRRHSRGCDAPAVAAASMKIAAQRVVQVDHGVLAEALVGVRRARPRAARTGAAWRPGRPRACRWNSRCSWVTLVSTADVVGDLGDPVLGQAVGGRLDDREPVARVDHRRRCAWSSGASGVVARPGLPRLWPPDDDIDGAQHARCGRPQASSIERTRYDVVVLPSVPVMPTMPSRGWGRPRTRPRATASARRGRTRPAAGARPASGTARSRTSAAAPAATAARRVVVAVVMVAGDRHEHASRARTRRESWVTPRTATSGDRSRPGEHRAQHVAGLEAGDQVAQQPGRDAGSRCVTRIGRPAARPRQPAGRTADGEVASRIPASRTAPGRSTSVGPASARPTRPRTRPCARTGRGWAHRAPGARDVPAGPRRPARWRVTPAASASRMTVQRTRCIVPGSAWRSAARSAE